MNSTRLSSVAQEYVLLETPKIIMMMVMFVLAIVTCSYLNAYIVYVDAGADSLGADGSLEHPYSTVQNAINHAFNDTYAENTPGTAVTIIVRDSPTGYIENLCIDYIGQTGIHNVNSITLQSESGNPDLCEIFASSLTQPVISIHGAENSVICLQGVTIKHSSMALDALSYGISFDNQASGSFGTIEISRCMFENNSVAFRIDVLDLEVDTLKIVESTILLPNQQTYYAAGLSFMYSGIVTCDSLLVQGCRFVNPNTSIRSSGIDVQHHLGKLFLLDNEFENVQIDIGAEAFHTDSTICDNIFSDTQLHINGCGDCLIQGNVFDKNGSSLVNSVWITGGSAMDPLSLWVLGNSFYDYTTPLKIEYPSPSNLNFVTTAKIIQNSFINCEQIINIACNNPFAPTITICEYCNNLYHGSSDSPFLVLNLNGQSVDLTGDYRIPVTYSHFTQHLVNTNSLIIDSANVSYGDPGITIDSQSNTYTLNWNTNERSPLILAGVGNNGIDSNNCNDKFDIGAVQYSEYPHEYKTYRFPAYSERNGIKWMSFPTIDRIWNPTSNDPDVAGVFFEPILDNAILHDISWKVQDAEEQSIIYNGSWTGDLPHNIIPQQGYKIQMAQGLQAPVSISVPGIIPEATQYPLTIKAHRAAKNDPYNQYNENWLGFFNLLPTDVEDAFTGIIDNLWFIQTQNWTMVREKVLPGSPWIYALQKGKKPILSYGDMVIVKCFSDAQFIWNTGAVSQIPLPKEQPSHYSFTEKADYVPIYVEMDADDLPTEIALFVDNVCMGAAVVSDSLVEIPGYIVGGVDPDAEVEILAFYESKSSVDAVPAYRVWNPESGAYDNQPLHLSGKNHYYKLKLVMDGNEAPTISDPAISICPNPFNHNTTIRFCMAKPAEIKLEIYNQKGQLVKSLAQGRADSGWSSINWDGTDNHNRKVSSGLYLSKLSYDGRSVLTKMILMK